MTGAARLSVIGHSVAGDPEEATVSEHSAERRPIGWWLKTADARIEQVFDDVFESQSITRREWQVLEPVFRAPVTEPELLRSWKRSLALKMPWMRCADAVCWPTAQMEF
ncbi:MAG: hypothetical protein ACR2KJ_09940 [Jatrophihabitans sp.]